MFFKGVRYCFSMGLPFAFHYLSNVPLSYGFYLYLAKLLMLLLVLITFLKVSTWYKLQQRQIVANVHAIAEDHWERYMHQREEYEKLWGTDDTLSCSYTVVLIQTILWATRERE